MKFFLIAAVVLLALAQESFAEDVAFDGFSQFLEQIKNKLNNQDMEKYQAAMEENKEKLEPLTEAMKNAANNLNEQMGPQLQQFQQTFEMQFKSILEKMKETTKTSHK